MTTAFDALREANREIIAGLDAREQDLLAREKTLAAEMDKVINERRAVVADRETIRKAEAIQARVFGVEVVPTEPAPRNPVYELGRAVGQVANAMAEAAAAKELQSRARIGPQRYAMWATLRDQLSLSAEALAARTGLNIGRVREQMRSDHPLYVRQDVSLAGPESVFTLTREGYALLERFESYRKAQGKPLPSLMPGENAAEDDETDPTHSKSDQAGASGLLARP
jgi:hypothetical protein